MNKQDFINTRITTTATHADQLLNSDYYNEEYNDGACVPETVYVYNNFWIIEVFDGMPDYHLTVHNYSECFTTLEQAENKLFELVGDYPAN